MSKNGGGRRRRESTRMPFVRGFVRGQLVDCLTGETQTFDWRENTVTQFGHSALVRAFAGLAGALPAQWLAVGLVASTAASSDLSMQSALATEYALPGGLRAHPDQSIAGVFTLSQSLMYASSHLPDAAAIDAIAQYGVSTVGGGSAMSIALFSSLTKGSHQALALTYNWVLGP